VPQPARDTPASASPVKKKRETYFKQASFSNFRPQKEVFNFFNLSVYHAARFCHCSRKPSEYPCIPVIIEGYEIQD